MSATDQDLKNVVKLISDAATLGSSLSGGFSFAEIAEIVTVGQDVQSVFANPSVIWPEYEQLTQAQIADLTAYIQANVTIPSSASIQSVLQAILSAAAAFSQVVQVLAPVI